MILGIYGTGGSGREVCEMLDQNESVRNQWEEVVFIDDSKEPGVFKGKKVMPFNIFCQEYAVSDAQVIIALGEPKYRKMLGDRVREAGYELATIIHPLAMVSPSAKIGNGVMLQDYVAVSAGAVIGNNVFINGRTVVGHDVEIGENSQISSHVIIAGYTKVEAGAYIGVASAIRDHLHIGENVIVSMGAIVMKDVQDNKVVMGNPAREISENKDGLVFKG